MPPVAFVVSVTVAKRAVVDIVSVFASDLSKKLVQGLEGKFYLTSVGGAGCEADVIGGSRLRAGPKFVPGGCVWV